MIPDDDSDEPEFEPPDAELVKRRWIPKHRVDWARRANEIIRGHGAVWGRTIYEARHQARWRAQKLIDLLVALELYERWQLSEHTEKRSGGWVWSVEYKGGR